MHGFHFATEIHRLAHLSYGGMFLFLLASGHIVPIPESVTLILLGYVASLGTVHILGVLLVGIFTAFFLDMCIYFLSLGGSELLVRYSKKIKHSLIDRYHNAEERHLFFLVLASHFVPGWRLANPIIAGITQMPWRKFALYTLISSFIYAPIFVLSGYYFSAHLAPVITAIESVRHLFLILFLVSLGTIVVVYNMHRHAKE